mmetsp:Transcript_19090/g.47919  ORF Transcript_19090/g.47919 Transcript_19090/m.47919 type:complete len:230 (-) Transcript_19090:181-870(-)
MRGNQAPSAHGFHSRAGFRLRRRRRRLRLGLGPRLLLLLAPRLRLRLRLRLPRLRLRLRLRSFVLLLRFRLGGGDGLRSDAHPIGEGLGRRQRRDRDVVAQGTVVRVVGLVAAVVPQGEVGPEPPHAVGRDVPIELRVESVQRKVAPRRPQRFLVLLLARRPLLRRLVVHRAAALAPREPLLLLALLALLLARLVPRLALARRRPRVRPRPAPWRRPAPPKLVVHLPGR